MSRKFGYFLAVVSVFAFAMLGITILVLQTNDGVIKYCEELKLGTSGKQAQARAIELLLTFEVTKVGNDTTPEMEAMASSFPIPSSYLHACVMRFDRKSKKLTFKALENTAQVIRDLVD